MRIVALADSDSYLKWGAALVSGMPPEWHRSVIVVDTPLVVSDGQLAAAMSGATIDSVARAGYRDLPRLLTEHPADAVLVAAPGPIAMVLIRIVASLDPRPVIVSGLPGISIPASMKALRFRRQADIMVVHSRREVGEFQHLADRRGTDQRIALASLPFLVQRPVAGTDLVFATQAIVPRVRGDRVRVAEALRMAALADPSRRVVVKIRTSPGERQTHSEVDGIPELIAELGPMPSNLVVSSGPMSEALDTAEGLVTVSSTAIIEALERGIPVLALDDFGVGRRLINLAFVDSGLFGNSQDLIARDYRHPDPRWVADNYFHDAAENDWIPALEHAIALRRAGRLAPRAAAVPHGGLLREAWERKVALGDIDTSLSGRFAWIVGRPLRFLVRRARRVRRRYRARYAPTAPLTNLPEVPTQIRAISDGHPRLVDIATSLPGSAVTRVDLDASNSTSDVRA
ncbi:MAG TPA: DUF6716 putative glycosyltransferase [Pseudolysinimonas sp.]|nr:DUF6716 putative glycosyltransferase [Pseudolysinimonas sp.]